MAESPELVALGACICRGIDVLVACLDGLSNEEARWRPPVPDANSLLVLALHTIGSIPSAGCDAAKGGAAIAGLPVPEK